jgi:peptidyl-prolyl cis-trans isomerase SurA
MLRWARCTGSLLLLLPCFVSVEAKVIDGIAAVVNDDVILQSELLQLVEPYRQQYEAQYSGRQLNDKIRMAAKELLNAMIEKRLLLQEATRRGVEIESSRIDEAVKEIRDRFDSDEEFRKALAEQGETMATFRRKHEEELIVRKMSSLKVQEIDKEVSVSEQDVQDYYEKHEEELLLEPKVELLKIFVSAEASLPADQRALRRGALENVLEELEAGADFERIAERLAEGGTDVPVEVARGGAPAELKRAVSSLQNGEVSDILESEKGFYIVKVVRSDPQTAPDKEELRARTKATLRKLRVQQEWNDWLKKLREDARVSIYFR